MNAVILAAGVASRLRPLTDSVPKCLLPVGGRSILHRTLTNLVDEGIRRVVIVTGYRAAQIREAVAAEFPRLDAVFIHNPVYETTNNMYSLWLAREALASDAMLLLDSDIVFDRRIVGALTGSGHANCLALNASVALGDEEIKVRADGGGRITEISKQVPPAEAVGESIGIELFSAPATRELLGVAGRMITEEQLVNVFYEAAFERAIRAGMDLRAVDVSRWPCMEIDTAGDLETAAREIVPRLGLPV
jgi:choline kinase